MVPKYLLSSIWPPGQIPVLDTEFDWLNTNETKWLYGNIASTTKIYSTSRLGAPISLLCWQLKRYNCRLASMASNAEGSLRLLCDLCSKFQIFTSKPNPNLRFQGCSMCLDRVNLVDTTCLVRIYL